MFTSLPIPAYLYNPLHTYLAVGLCFMTALYFIHASGNSVLYARSKTSIVLSVTYGLFLIILLGLRPVFAMKYFGDSSTYAAHYETILNTNFQDEESDWLWLYLMYYCRYIGLGTSDFFLLVTFLYIGGQVLCCYVLMRNNPWLAVLLCFASFSFFSYGVNGLRNGLACSFVLVGLSLIGGSNKVGKILAVLCLMTATFFHKSTTLPVLACLLACFLIRKPKTALWFWLVSIPISLTAGSMVESVFLDLGFDDRLTYYLAGQDDEEMMNQFSDTGFRWDFLLYSAAPVLLIWYATVKRSFDDRSYNIIAVTYLISNAFWIMIIRAAFSSRFAYLSWFVYPIVLAYPLLRFNMWEKQNRKAAYILMAYALFTLIMFLKGREL